MEYEEIIFQGSRSDVEELLTSLRSIEELDDIKLHSVAGSAGSFLGREPLNQIEIVDVVVGIAVNLVSSAAYDQIRKKIDDRAKKKGFTRRSSRHGS